MITPTPLPPNSRKLNVRRFEVDLSMPSGRTDPTSGRPTWRVTRTARFATEQNARSWAESERAAGQHASVNRFSAVDGWKCWQVGRLTDAGWQS